jgi:hypothetical protein
MEKCNGAISMIENTGTDNYPDKDARVYRIKDLNDFIMKEVNAYDSDDIYLDPHTHKQTFINCHYLNKDHLFSASEYHHEVMRALADLIIKSLLEKKCVITATVPDNEFVVLTDLGVDICDGLVMYDLTKDELEFLHYVREKSRPLNIMDTYRQDDITFSDGEDEF